MTKKRSVYRFVSGNNTGSYSVWRGDQWLGHVTKQVHRHTARGVTTRIVAGWKPSDSHGSDLATQPTRETAAQALWQTRRGQA